MQLVRGVVEAEILSELRVGKGFYGSGEKAQAVLEGLSMKATNPEDFVNAIEQAATDAEAKAKLEAGKAHVTQAAQELKEAAVLKAQQMKDNTVQRAVDVRRNVENRVQDARSRCESKTREEPTKCLLMAFGAGFVLGLIFRR